ncbi:G-patch domain-containing protein [Aphelenchoides fujianensis]|nr:G-patch domain-containing protein [Aphelenchoides fujianensis]
MSLAPFGTAHEALEDEQNTAVSRKPKGIQDEIVTDEKGRRRFHGAFTGGFSAGYFNTVGSKEGWTPQTFKSTRGERAEAVAFDATDFMDEEDRGEFGFAARRIRARDDFLDQVVGAGGKAGGTERLAWERAGPSTSAAAAPLGELSDIATQLAQTIKPVNDSVGVRILKQMGWRPGKGIGPRMKRRALEKQKLIDDRTQGRKSRFDEVAVREIEEHAPEMEFAPDDIPALFFQPNNGVHGMGYKPLEHSNVLTEDFTQKVNALKTKQKSKGIRGQAFGVGAFEEDDDDVYTSEDLSKYDYSIGEGPEVPLPGEVQRYDSAFVPSQRTERPTFYRAPMPTRHFDGRHKSEGIILKDLPPTVLHAIKHLSPLEKAVFLGDRSRSVMELLSTSDRKKLELLTLKAEKKPEEKAEREKPQKIAEAEPFEEEPLKAHRFKQYVHYLKSGYDMQPPVEMTRLEWEAEQKEFENHLTPELRALLPSVRARQEPLAKLITAQPFADQLKSRFQSETGKDTHVPETKEEGDKKAAVLMKRFGALTRTKHQWNPSKLLCRYFNVEDPYPNSTIVGSLELMKKVPTANALHSSTLGLPNTERDLIDKMRKEASEKRQSRWDNKPQEPTINLDERDEKYKKKADVIEKPLMLPPEELLQSLFELDASPLSSSSSSEDEDEAPRGPALSPLPAAKKPAQPAEKFVTVMDLELENEEYGPKIPDHLPEPLPLEEKVKIVPVAPEPEIIRLDSDDSDDSTTKRPKKKSKRADGKAAKQKKSKKKHKSKSKKSKKHRKRRHSSSSSSGESSD